MKFVDPDGTFPLYVGDVTRIKPDWQEGEALPEGWRQVVETSVPSDYHENTTKDTLNPEPVEGYIPEGCEGIKENISFISYNPTAVFNAETNTWNEVWEQEIVSYDEPYPIVAVMVDGEWLTPEQYRAAS
tara:strand:+ start:1497 stop:1886 length:390 start_codon:yes stop_codon:yes gene_type:complete